MKVKITPVFLFSILIGASFLFLTAWNSPGRCIELGDDSEVPSFDNAASRFPLPGTKRIYLQQPGDYKIVQARPDFKLQMKSATFREYVTGFGFVILKNDKVESFDFERTQQQFVDKTFPMLKQRITQDGFVCEQIAFTTIVGGRPLVMVRMRVTPEKRTSADTFKLAWLTVRQPHRRFHSHSNEDYIVFESWAPAWGSGLDLRYEKGFFV